ncbi:nucleoside diphosphate kinase [Paenibacillus sp. UNCCL117]|uniref:nucleoside-diphosphate kinase n=1 Tax=unclassified Paenibacillus TaxID=185978 RepID=UPI0008827C3A|nr:MULTISPECIES: nucleoside-diphosphate kinase [unclassified Paenibacillus]SDD41786.1 nucleoside diphosphate kinase [Paenibacillus sp. cl123]SFW47759.1 nucleoside diphosphate kinase [Paenibacillus sp. UNCCL117]
MEYSFLMVKPDGVRRQLIGNIVRRFENRGFVLVGAKMMTISREQAERHYGQHREKPFFGELVDFITSGPVFAMIWKGDNLIEVSRIMMGKTNPLEAAPGTIRGDFATYVGENVIHGSDSPESAKRELDNFFTPDELVAAGVLSSPSERLVG